MFCWELDCSRTVLILEFITSDTTDWYCVTYGQSHILWKVHVGFLCPDVCGPSWKRPPTMYLSVVWVRGCKTCLQCDLTTQHQMELVKSGGFSILVHVWSVNANMFYTWIWLDHLHFCVCSSPLVEYLQRVPKNILVCLPTRHLLVAVHGLPCVLPHHTPCLQHAL